MENAHSKGRWGDGGEMEPPQERMMSAVLGMADVSRAKWLVCPVGLRSQENHGLTGA